MPDTPDTSLALKDLADLLDKAELRYTHAPDSDVLRVTFSSDHYVDETGDKRICIFLTVQPDEQLVVADIPWVYRLEDARDKQAARKALLYVNFSVKAAHFGVDPEDRNEVRARAEIWLKGVVPSGEFIGAALGRLAGQVDYCARLLGPVWRGGKKELRALIERNMRPAPARFRNKRSDSVRREPPRSVS
jgi:hypothetical protein